MIAHVRSVVSRLARDVEYVEVRIEETQSTGIGFRGRSLDSLRESFSRGGCVRVYHQGGWGFATFTDLDRLEEFLVSAIKQARLVGRGGVPLAPVEPVKARVQPEIGTDPRCVPLEDKIEILRGYNELILDFDPARIPTSSVGYQDA